MITFSTQIASQGVAFFAPAEDFAEVTWKTGILVLWGGLIPPLVIVLRRGIRRQAAGRPAASEGGTSA